MTQFDAVLSDEDDEPIEGTDDQSNLRRQLRQSQKNNKALAVQVEEAQSLRKENAFLKAGLPDSPVARLYMTTYTGDLSDEAIKAGAAELGIIATPDAAATAEVTQIEQQSSAMGGSTQSLTPDSQHEMWREFEKVLQAGGNGEEVLRRWGVPTASDDR